MFALGAHPLRRARLAVLSVAIAMAACASKPQAPVPAPKVEGLPELMHRAATAQASGDREKARELYRSAAKAEPTSKAPWLKLAEGYFESGDYGNAVLAAQEVIHRDASDSVAAGVLAVSGLRISTAALATLRQHSSIAAGTRTEAQMVVQTLRDVLGEPVLVPRPQVEPVAAPPPKPRRRVRAAKPVRPVAAKTQPKRVPPPAAGGNPFDALK